jgi:hypothetical protein
MGNSRGSYYSTPENHMRAYDKLPSTVRQALASADFDYATQPILTRWRRGTSPKALVRFIRRWDRDERKRQSKRQPTGR